MITLKNIQTLSGTVIDHVVESPHMHELDAQKRLMMLPALIDTNAVLENFPKGPQPSPE